MRLFILWVILRKELTETLRDRKTWMRLLLIPVLVYPLFAIGVSKLEGSRAEAREARASTVAVWGELPAAVSAVLAEKGKVELRAWEGAPEAIRRDLAEGKLAPPPIAPEPEAAAAGDDAGGKPKKKHSAAPGEPEHPVIAAARALVGERKVDAVLVPWPGFEATLRADGKAPITVYYDSVRAESQLARDRLDDGLRAARKSLVEARESAHGLPKGFSLAVDIRARDVAPESRRLGQVLGAMMPMLLILMSLVGGLLPAIDLTAGEKERGTMQTLLCAPVAPIEIIAGKFLTVFVVSLLTALANVVSMAFTMRRILPGELEASASVYALAFALLIPVTLLFSALFLALSCFAKDYKDAQNVIMPAYLPIALVAGLGGMPGLELNGYTAFAPILNIALLIKALFIGEGSADLVMLTLASSSLYAALALVFAARVFENNNVLLGGKESARAVLGLRRRQGGEPTAGFSLTVFAVVLVVCFYAAQLLQGIGTATQIVLTQVGFFLVPTVASLALSGFSLPASLALRAPSARSMLSALLLGGSGWAVIAGLVSRLLPPPDAFVEKLEAELLLGGKPFFVLLLVTALTPAICEELLFRGMLVSGLRRLGTPAAVVISALLFGIAHASIYRLLPTFFLGSVLALARLRSRSILPGMLIHFANNGIAVGLLYFRPAWAEQASRAGTFPLALTGGALVMFVAGLLLLPRGEGEEQARKA
ncbi:MAG: ABC transporter permease subunit/CPBP intramembrane protease [Byssovorax sp.]